jgi:hypothetical protein
VSTSLPLLIFRKYLMLVHIYPTLIYLNINFSLIINDLDDRIGTGIIAQRKWLVKPYDSACIKLYSCKMGWWTDKYPHRQIKQMDIRNLLEGLIRVPETVTQKGVKAVLSYALAYVARNGEERAQKEARFLINELKADYFDADDTGSLKTAIPVAELPDSYRRRIPASRKTLPVHLFIGADIIGNGTPGEYSKKVKAVYIDIVNIPDWDRFLSEPYKNTGRYTRSIRAIVEHEYMHAIQDQAFGEKMDVDYVDDQGDLILPKYHNTPTEIGPLILTYAQQFIAELKPAAKQRIRNGDYSDISRSVEYTQFFNDLKEKSLNKWKKAVKYYHGLIVQRIND